MLKKKKLIIFQFKMNIFPVIVKSSYKYGVDQFHKAKSYRKEVVQ